VVEFAQFLNHRNISFCVMLEHFITAFDQMANLHPFLAWTIVLFVLLRLLGVKL